MKTKLTKQKAFTIIELLTVMSIIVILIGLLVPALTRVRRYAKKVNQNAQFHSIEAALELFHNEFDGYPDSSPTDSLNNSYCGAMKLGEAMMGQDVLGFHPDSVFRADGFNMDGTIDLYPPNPTPANLKIRRGPFLPPESANAYQIGDVYYQDTTPRVGPFDPCSVVLCDVYERTAHRITGTKLGMPVLYYKADTAKSLHDIANPDDEENIYDYKDNQQLLELGKPDDTSPLFVHPLAVDTNPGSSAGTTPGARFYLNTRSNKVTTLSRPYKAESYILISAGFDGEYGTSDDICNFDWKFTQ